MKIVICDDNDQHLNYYSDMIAGYISKYHIDAAILRYTSGKQLLFDMESASQFPDIIFLDIGMPGMDGMETAETLRDRSYLGEIIFITKSQEQEHFLSAFDVSAMHYIVKNVTSKEKIEEILLRAVKRAQDRADEYILVAGGGEYRNISISSIRFFEINRKIVTVYYHKTESFEFFCGSLEKIHSQLENHNFLRIHRSYLVATSQIAKLSYEAITLKDGQVLPVGRKYYHALKEKLSVPLG